MLRKPVPRLGQNLRTLLLAFLLALVVWVSAVTAANPDEARVFTSVALEVVGKAPEMLVTSNNIPETVVVTLYAPRSLLDRYESNQGALLRAWVDLTGYESGAHQVPVQVAYQLRPTNLVQVEPLFLDITLDRLVSEPRPVRLQVSGSLTRGYQAETPLLEMDTAAVSGPQALVARVVELRAVLNINNATEDIEVSLRLDPIDETGSVVTGVKVTPSSVQVTQPITLLGGYRNVVVRVVTTGQVANGYRLTNISVSPPGVTIFSANPQLVNNLPGYVDTQPLDLTGVTDDLDVRLALNLPEGVSIVGEQSVLVQVSIAAIESSLSVSVPVEFIGLAPGLNAEVSPETVDVLLSGPVLLLDALLTTDVRVYLDLTDLEIGVYQLTPVIEVVSTRVMVESVLPETLEVEILIAPTPTATPTANPAGFVTPSSTPQP